MPLMCARTSVDLPDDKQHCTTRLIKDVFSRSSDLDNQIQDTEGLYIKTENYMYLSDRNGRFVDL